MAYYITDMLWGILHAERLIGLVYADTVIHFIAMAAAVMLWTRYVISYLGEQNTFSRFLYFAGRMFLIADLCHGLYAGDLPAPQLCAGG